MKEITEEHKHKGQALIEAIIEDLYTSDLNVCHTGDLREETEITAVALAITTLKTIIPTVTEDGDGEWDGVLRYLMTQVQYTDLDEE